MGQQTSGCVVNYFKNLPLLKNSSSAHLHHCIWYSPGPGLSSHSTTVTDKLWGVKAGVIPQGCHCLLLQVAFHVSLMCPSVGMIQTCKYVPVLAYEYFKQSYSYMWVLFTYLYMLMEYSYLLQVYMILPTQSFYLLVWHTVLLVHEKVVSSIWLKNRD